MSEENVEVVRRMFTAFGQGGPEAVREYCDPRIDGQGVENPSPFIGPDGVVAMLSDWTETWGEFRIEPRQFRDTGDHVLVDVHQWGRGKGSGAEVENRYYQVYTVRDGKIARFREYSEKAQALADAGLSE